MIGAEMFGATYPWNTALDAQLRQANVVDPLRFQPLNDGLLLELSTVVGEEGYDFQNPYVWQSRGVLPYPDPNLSGLVPAYGDTVRADPGAVSRNVMLTAHALEV